MITESDRLINSNIMESANLLSLVKQSLSIVEDSTLKDDEIKMWIRSAIFDLKRQDIDVDNCIDSDLLQGTIVMFCKANFGMTDLQEKKRAEETYHRLCTNLSLSREYQKEVEND